MAVTVVWMDTPLLCFGFVNDSFLEFGKGSANISYFAPSSIITKCPVFGHGSGLGCAGLDWAGLAAADANCCSSQ